MTKTVADFIVNSNELLNTKFDPLPFVMTPWLLRQSINMIYGWRGTGKTYLAMQLAASIAHGTSFLRWSTPIPSHVLYIDGEMGLRALKKRLEAMEERPEGDNLTFMSLDKCSDGVIWNLADPVMQPNYDILCDGYDVIFIDNIATCCRLMDREMEASSWNKVQKWALAQRSKGKCVIFIHHAGKNGLQRGVSNREDTMNQVIKLDKNALCDKKKTQFQLTFDKTRDIYGEEAEPLLVTMQNYSGVNSWSFEKVESEKKTKIISLKSAGCSARDIADALTIPIAEVKEALANLNFVEENYAKPRERTESDSESERDF